MARGSRARSATTTTTAKAASNRQSASALEGGSSARTLRTASDASRGKGSATKSARSVASADNKRRIALGSGTKLNAVANAPSANGERELGHPHMPSTARAIGRVKHQAQQRAGRERQKYLDVDRAERERRAECNNAAKRKRRRPERSHHFRFRRFVVSTGGPSPGFNGARSAALGGSPSTSPGVTAERSRSEPSAFACR